MQVAPELQRSKPPKRLRHEAFGLEIIDDFGALFGREVAGDVDEAATVATGRGRCGAAR